MGRKRSVQISFAAKWVTSASGAQSLWGLGIVGKEVLCPSPFVQSAAERPPGSGMLFPRFQLPTPSRIFRMSFQQLEEGLSQLAAEPTKYPTEEGTCEIRHGVEAGAPHWFIKPLAPNGGLGGGNHSQNVSKVM